MNKHIIQNNFSKNAASYDDHSVIQTKCAERLLGINAGRKFSRILEVGCGTGIYTQFLCSEYKNAEITAVDISSDMIKIAKNKVQDESVLFKIADAEHIITDKKFDLITSNASFQWFSNLDATFARFAELLTDEGILCFSMYGPETFNELKEVIKKHFGMRRRLTSSRFASRDEVKSSLEKYFNNIDLTEEYFTADFITFIDFLRDIKHSGTRGEGLVDNIFLGKYRVLEMEKTYIEIFKRIIATHHVYFCVASK